MSDIVIKVDNLSKQYRLGTVGTGTLSHDLNRWWHLIRGKEDPYLKIGEANDRTIKGESDYVWALQNINFEVKRGDVLGIIGKNGAGKSTLLKILSRTTSPTTGTVKAKGKVASLLEVGTGFHPELSGRENIFLNGAILGMTKTEVSAKIDEIIDFSGVERYIDTPVKRYSSGMYVRLAFAVAAHLEPDILIVDEVLAVGDIEFQKKCIGKLQNVSKEEGRTILFVSHNIAALANLCTRGIVLQNGSTVYNGLITDAISKYQGTINNRVEQDLELETARSGNGKALITACYLENNKQEHVEEVLCGEDIYVCITLKTKAKPISKVDIGFAIHDEYSDCISVYFTSYNNQYFEYKHEGYFTTKFKIPKLPLTEGVYNIRGRIEAQQELIDWPENFIASFRVLPGDFYNSGYLNLHRGSKFYIKPEVI
ncbi:ABC transporter ATP-binding protein [Pontibacter sp. Tf4]|uniref:ABC transporter ATP-binding protein n=1 Tax=Pontibacter sp. Tf4 TaxID=2761620 RepID=UPI001626137C|nr:ABC transporter ATP-binding protein [Pontibacter sp. Tf4]MBB6610342.1 ABC transporter ATP-binding protein [Pontibacter sp. Tf4]